MRQSVVKGPEILSCESQAATIIHIQIPAGDTSYEHERFESNRQQTE